LLAVASLSGDCGEPADIRHQTSEIQHGVQIKDEQFRTGLYGSTVGAPNV
jgi:hypothetical protein